MGRGGRGVEGDTEKEEGRLKRSAVYCYDTCAFFNERIIQNAGL